MLDKEKILKLIERISLEAFQEGQHEGLGMVASARRHRLEKQRLEEELREHLGAEKKHIFHHPV